MASYKDILNSTMQTLGDKVREISDKGGVKGLYDRGAERARSYAQAAKLSLAIKSEQEQLNKTYAALGKLFFEQNPVAPDPMYATLYSQAQEILSQLHEKETALDALRTELEAAQAAASGDIEVEIADFEQIVQATEADGRGN